MAPSPRPAPALSSPKAAGHRPAVLLVFKPIRKRENKVCLVGSGAGNQTVPRPTQRCLGQQQGEERGRGVLGRAVPLPLCRAVSSPCCPGPPAQHPPGTAAPAPGGWVWGVQRYPEKVRKPKAPTGTEVTERHQFVRPPPSAPSAPTPGAPREGPPRSAVLPPPGWGCARTCSTERLVCPERLSFSCSEGYALKRCSYSHSRRIRTDSLGRLPLLFLLFDCDGSRAAAPSSSPRSLSDMAGLPAARSCFEPGGGKRHRARRGEHWQSRGPARRAPPARARTARGAPGGPGRARLPEADRGRECGGSGAEGGGGDGPGRGPGGIVTRAAPGDGGARPLSAENAPGGVGSGAARNRYRAPEGTKRAAGARPAAGAREEGRKPETARRANGDPNSTPPPPQPARRRNKNRQNQPRSRTTAPTEARRDKQRRARTKPTERTGPGLAQTFHAARGGGGSRPGRTKGTRPRCGPAPPRPAPPRTARRAAPSTAPCRRARSPRGTPCFVPLRLRSYPRAAAAAAWALAWAAPGSRRRRRRAGAAVGVREEPSRSGGAGGEGPRCPEKFAGRGGDRCRDRVPFVPKEAGTWAGPPAPGPPARPRLSPPRPRGGAAELRSAGPGPPPLAVGAGLLAGRPSAPRSAPRCPPPPPAARALRSRPERRPGAGEREAGSGARRGAERPEVAAPRAAPAPSALRSGAFNSRAGKSETALRRSRTGRGGVPSGRAKWET